ncbi:bifunctional metallophosphatase/5'-nucleotidase [Prevotella ihumii]|uniref:bifunctional metallophosphatase/5'-nucleotidase n=1 Tax=Prevotella ihumii TaxID=1917878 RepID=UPI0009810B13|nr:metallophosphatase [Prevotella ihumii]
MKKNILLVALCMLTTVAFGQKKQLTILHTNDTHSQIMPFNVTLADTMRAGRAGFIRRIEMLKQERAKDSDLLLFDSGDFCQGSPYFTMYKGDVEVGLMNEMHYDAGTIGNHEFDFGLDNMIKMFKNLNFPIVCANYDFADTELAKVVKPYVILKRKGLKIGVFGVSPVLEGLVLTANYGPLKYKDPIACAQKCADELKAKGCDLVICLSHLGLNIEGISDEELVAGTRGIDLILGGHSHTFLEQLVYVNNLDGKAVGIDQNGKSAIFVGKMVLNLKKK